MATEHISGGAVLLLWWLGAAILGWIARTWRKACHRRAAAAELRHQRRVELARAKAGVPPPKLLIGHLPKTATDLADPPPSAALAAPPSAQPAAVPGQCRHEKIVPAITDDGELVRWLCAAPQCRAEFPPSTAMYVPPEPKP